MIQVLSLYGTKEDGVWYFTPVSQIERSHNTSFSAGVV
jgi:hypothetical protein